MNESCTCEQTRTLTVHALLGGEGPRFCDASCPEEMSAAAEYHRFALSAEDLGPNPDDLFLYFRVEMEVPADSDAAEEAITNSALQRAQELYDRGGLTVAEIAKRVGVIPSAIQRYIDTNESCKCEHGWHEIPTITVYALLGFEGAVPGTTPREWCAAADSLCLAMTEAELSPPSPYPDDLFYFRVEMEVPADSYEADAAIHNSAKARKGKHSWVL